MNVNSKPLQLFRHVVQCVQKGKILLRVHLGNLHYASITTAIIKQILVSIYLLIEAAGRVSYLSNNQGEVQVIRSQCSFEKLLFINNK